MKFTNKGLGVESPDEIVTNLWAKIPLHIKITFLSACISGLIAHLFMFTTKMLNHDDIGALFASDYGTASGRWFLPYVSNLDGGFSVPWLLGVLSIFIIAVAACFTVSVMRIRRPLGCVLTASLMVTFPVVTATMSYMFSADAYFLALALACFSAYITNKYKWGILPGAAAIALSMGIYQSYFGVAAVLMVGLLILDTLDGVLPVQKLIIKGVKLVATLALGMAAYMIIVKLSTRGTELVSYMGISEMGKLSPAVLPKLIAEAYLEYGQFFLFNKPAVHFSFLKYAFLLTGVATILLVVFIIIKRKLKTGHIVLLALLAVVFPLAGNIVYVMVPNAPVHVLMLFGMIGILLAPLALVEYSIALTTKQAAAKAPIWQRNATALCCWVIVGTLALTSFSYTIFSNEAYLKMNMTYEQTYSFSTRLLSSIEGVDGYDAGKTVVFIGRALDNVPHPPTPELDRIVLAGVADMPEMVNSYTYGYYLRRFHGASNIIHTSGSDSAKQYEGSNEVADMPSYPTDGSIKVIGDNIVVKFS